jgi:transcriptional regulator with XRE-family HTH domain
MALARDKTSDRSIGERVREARQRAGISQRGLAHMIGVSFQLVNHWELGRKNPTFDQIKWLEQTLFSDKLMPQTVTVVLKTEEFELVQYYRRMSDGQQKNLLKMVVKFVAVREGIENKREPVQA